MANLDTGEIRPWASLTNEERESGRWVPLPDKDENGEPVLARFDTGKPLRDMFPKETSYEERMKQLRALLP